MIDKNNSAFSEQIPRKCLNSADDKTYDDRSIFASTLADEESHVATGIAMNKR